MGLLKKKRPCLIETLPNVKNLVTELNTLLHELMSNLDKNFSIVKLNRIAELLQQIYAQLNIKRPDIQREAPKFHNQIMLLIARFNLMVNEIAHIPRRNKEEAEIFLEAVLQELIALVEELLNLMTQIETGLRASKVVIWRIIKTKTYNNNMKKNVYATNKTLVEKIEQRILEYFKAGGLPGKSNLAKTDISGLTNHLHAYIPEPLDNHRILYNVDIPNKEIKFLRIDTHKKLGFGGSGS